LIAKRDHKVRNNPVMLSTRPRHGKHLARMELAPELSPALDGKILLLGQKRFGILRHSITFPKPEQLFLFYSTSHINNDGGWRKKR